MGYILQERWFILGREKGHAWGEHEYIRNARKAIDFSSFNGKWPISSVTLSFTSEAARGTIAD